LTQILAGAKASNIDESGLGEYQKSIFARLSQEGKTLTPENVHAATLSGANIAGRLGFSGEAMLGAQQSIGRVEGINQDQMWAMLGTLTSKGKAGAAGMDAGKAAQSLNLLATNLHAIPDEAQKMMGPELTQAIQKQMEGGSIMGAIDTLKSAMDQQGLDKSSRSEFLLKLGGKRALPAIERLMSGMDISKGYLQSSRDEKFFDERLAKATEGGSATEMAVKAREHEVLVDDPDAKRLERNEQLLRLLDAQLADKKGGSGIGAWRRSFIMDGGNFGLSHIPLIGDKLPTVGGYRNMTKWSEAAGFKPDLYEGFKKRAAWGEGYTAMDGNTVDPTFAKVIAEFDKAQSGAGVSHLQVPKVAIPTIPQQRFGKAFRETDLDKAKHELEMAEAHKFQAEANAPRDSKGNIRKSAQRAIDTNPEFGKEALAVLQAMEKRLEAIEKNQTKNKGRKSG
jgi:hypothetical protein